MPDVPKRGRNKDFSSHFFRWQLMAGIYSFSPASDTSEQLKVCVFWLRLVPYVCHVTAPFPANGWRLHKPVHEAPAQQCCAAEELSAHNPEPQNHSGWNIC